MVARKTDKEKKDVKKPKTAAASAKKAAASKSKTAKPKAVKPKKTPSPSKSKTATKSKTPSKSKTATKSKVTKSKTTKPKAVKPRTPSPSKSKVTKSKDTKPKTSVKSKVTRSSPKKDLPKSITLFCYDDNGKYACADDEFCNATDRSCVKSTKAGKPWGQPTLEKKFGSDFTFDQSHRLIGRKEDVAAHIALLKKLGSSAKATKATKATPAAKASKSKGTPKASKASKASAAVEKALKCQDTVCADGQSCNADTGRCKKFTDKDRKGKYQLEVEGRVIIGSKASIEKLRDILGGEVSKADRSSSQQAIASEPVVEALVQVEEAEQKVEAIENEIAALQDALSDAKEEREKSQQELEKVVSEAEIITPTPAIVTKTKSPAKSLSQAHSNEILKAFEQCISTL